MTEESRHRPLACIVMAGGKGTRMRSALPKVLHPVCGRPILGWVLRAAREAGADRLVVVVPPDADEVRALVGDDATCVVQHDARGTGHAVMCGMAPLDGFAGDVLVVNGDHPLVRGGLLAALVQAHRDARAAATLLTTRIDLADPLDPRHAFGRVVRDADTNVERVVEVRDASADELAIAEANVGFYCFDADALRRGLGEIRPDNAQGELYLPDVVPALAAQGRRITGHLTDDDTSTIGVNTRVDLATAGRLMRERLLTAHMLAGAGILDPATTHIDADVVLEPDCVIHPFTVLRGRTHVAAGAEVGPHAVLVDATVGEDAHAGPFCYLRPGATLGARSKVGTFVEVKNSVIGEGAKAPHLSYIGDADVGAGSNIAAGNITANYNPVTKTKHRTVFGDGVNTGCDCVFVAPVTIGEGAFVAAGSIITDDVPADALAIARARQTNIDGYAKRSKDRRGQ